MRNQLIKALPTCARVLGTCETDPVVTESINEVQQRLIPMGKWPDTYQHYRFCVTSGCITLPWQLETVEVAAICNQPIRISNEWNQYVGAGFGLQGSHPCDFTDAGTGFCAFNDVLGSNKKLRVYSTETEASDSKILLQFWNENKIPVRTLDGIPPVLIDGEKVTISTTQTNTVNFCMPGGLVAVEKPITNGTVFLYEYDTVLLTQRMLAMYEPDETTPNYRRYIIPIRSSQSGAACDSTTVDVIAKRRFIPALKPADWLIIGNIPALKMGCIALRKEENNMWGEAALYWEGGPPVGTSQVGRFRGAKGILDDELTQFLGDGMETTMQLNDEFANAAVQNYL